MKPRIIAIVGPNASGKSDLAIWLAKKQDGEIISADSRQVFKGMDLGTGKVEGPIRDRYSYEIEIIGRRFFIAPRESGGVLHWLLDIVKPSETFNVAFYQKLAYHTIREILGRDHLPIFAGGTGLYIRAVLDGLSFPAISPDESLRLELEKKTLDELQRMILTIEPGAGETLDLNNRRRIIRALEITLASGKPLSAMRQTTPVFFDALTLGVLIPREKLKERIRERLDDRIEKGMIEEVEQLLKEGVTLQRLESFGLEYRYISRYLAGNLSRDLMVEQLYNEICRYAKRQMTWFNKYGNVHWISDREEAHEFVKGYLGAQKGGSACQGLNKENL